jgi:hypothetical protein
VLHKIWMLGGAPVAIGGSFRWNTPANDAEEDCSGAECEMSEGDGGEKECLREPSIQDQRKLF